LQVTETARDGSFLGPPATTAMITEWFRDWAGELAPAAGEVIVLKDVGVVDRDVVCFFVRCEADGMKRETWPPYSREWIEREKD